MNKKLFGLGISFVTGASLILINILYNLPTLGVGVALPFLYFSMWFLHEGIKLYRKPCYCKNGG